jgi:predicted DNA-binding transcriptional regulator AlpA
VQPPLVETLTQIENRLRLEYPFPQYVSEGGDIRPMTQSEYNQWIADQVVNIHNDQLAAYAEWQRAELRRQLKDSMEALDADIAIIQSGSNLNLRQVADMLGRTTTAVYNLVQVLIDRNLIERE